MAATQWDSFARAQTDALLALLDPYHFTASRSPLPTSALTRRRSKPRQRTPSVASTLSLLIPSPRPSRPASTLSRPSLPPLLNLPPELLLHILALALPATLNRRTAIERNHTLATLALVHPILRSFAQGELFHHVILQSDRAIERLARTTCVPKSKGQTLGSHIRSLQVYGSLSKGDGGKQLAVLVAQLKGLESLHLEDLDGLELRQFVVHPKLKTVTATRCGFRSRFRQVIASKPSHITTLSLTTCTAHDDAFANFTLPSLTTLTLHSIHLPPPSALATLEPSDAFRLLATQVAPHLESLTTDPAHLGFFFPFPRRTTQCALTSLHLVKLTSLDTVLDALPAAHRTALHTLSLTPSPTFTPTSTSPERAAAHFAALLAPFRAHAPAAPPALEGAERIVLDGRTYGAWYDRGEEAVVELVERAGKLGIEVVFEGGSGGSGGEGRARGMSASASPPPPPTQGGRRSSVSALLGGRASGAPVRSGGRWAAADWEW
ncbi:hypothetical protein JCM10207_000433 [Rhodosporidiobolus poonsookiae]